MTITEFLLARITEDESAAQRAQAVTAAEWVANGSVLMHIADPATRLAEATALVEDYRMDDAWRHAERHDPARVLAECQAKRAIIEWHKSWPVLIQTPPRMEPVNPTDPTTLTYRATQEIQWATQQQYIDRFGTEPPTAPMLEQLAAVYADHPDYDPSWRP